MRGKYHKIDCKCRLCTGIAGFQKGHGVIRTKQSYKKAGKKIKEIRMKNNNYNQTEETRKKISETLKYKYKNGIIKKPKTLWRKGHKINFGRVHTKETKKKIRISKEKYFEILGPREGKNETKILDKLAKQIGYKIIRQYIVIGYFLDGYVPELNLAIEVDESHHYDNGILNKKDIQRQKEIEKELKCEFIRIKDKDVHIEGLTKWGKIV